METTELSPDGADSGRIKRPRSGAASLLALIVLLASPAAAAGEEGFHVHGFSPDGRYFAFEDYGGYHAVGGFWSRIRVIDAAQDRMAHAPFLLSHPHEDEAAPEVPLGVTRAENLKRATATLRALGIRLDDPGERLVIADGRFELRGETYRLELSSKRVPMEACGYGGGTTGTFKLVMTGPRGSKVLHEETRVPRSRGREGCVGEYSISEVRAKGRRLVVVLHYDMPSPLEGRAGDDHLAVGATLDK